MLIPKQAIPGNSAQNAKPAQTGGSPVNKALGIMSDIAKAAEKLPPRKTRVETVYGTYEFELKGNVTRKRVNDLRERIEEQGTKEGWARVDGTVAEDGAKAVENFKKTTPAQYKKAQESASKARDASNRPESQPKKNPADLNKTRKIGPYAQSAIDAYDQSVSEADPMQEYTGGDMRLRRDVNKGKGLNASQQGRVRQPNNLTDVWGLDPVALQDNKANPAGDAEFWNSLKEGFNAKIGEQPLVRGINALSNTPLGMAMSAAANQASNAIKVTAPGMNRAQAFQDPADQALQTAYDFTLNAPSQLLGSVGNIFDKNVDNIGKAQSGAEIAAAIVPTYMSGKAGLSAYRAAKGLGKSTAEALAKGVGTAVADSVGISSQPSPKVQQFGESIGQGAEPASGVATPPKPHFTNGNEPTGMGGASTDTIPINKAFENYPPTKPTAPEAAPKVDAPAPGVENPAVNTTGISNDANLGDVEAGLLTEVAKGEGKSAKAVYEANRNREDYLEVAKRVRNGAPLSAEDTATLLAGGQKLTKRVYDTREAVKTAIANGADQATITRLNSDYAEARRVKDEFTQDVQRGKSGWSDVGRVLAQKVELDTGDIAQVMEEARIRKGGELTDKESIALKKQVDELQANAVESDKRINELMDQLVKAQEATRVTRKAGMSRVQTASVREQAKTRFTEARSKAKSVASLNALQGITDPDVIKSFKEYVNAVMDDGARSIQDIVEQMAKDGVSADSEDIYKAFTDRTGMRKLSDIQKELNKARREIVKDAVQGPNISPAQKKLRARISELENQIKTGDYIEAQPKIKREIEAEVYRLQQIKKMKDAKVKDALEQMRPKSLSEKLNALSSELKLLNPVSRLKDVISSTANLAATAGETPVRYAVDRITARIVGQNPIMMLSRESAGIANDRIAATLKTDVSSAWQGLDANTTEKFGLARGIGGRAAGVTDAPFKTVYREYANVRLAEEKARRILPKNATRGDIQNMRDSILANLDDHPDVKLGAEDVALYKTFNNQNAISKFNSMAKRGLNNDTATGFYDELIGRFSKVITNVNLDRLDRTGFGVVRGFTKLLRNKETLTVAERMIINDMISKGLVGMPIVATGYYMSDKIPAEIKDGYRKYIDRGDLGEIGGVVAAFLYGADMKAAEKAGKDANELRFSTTAGLALDNPMSTNLSDLFGLAKDPTASGFVDYAAKKVTNLIPGGIRETARRMDEPNMQGVPALVRPQSGQAKDREKYPRGTKARVNKLSADEQSAQAILDMLIGEGKSKIPYLRQTLPEKK